MPYHVAFDCYEEERLGKNSFGSTKSGIAPFYSDKYSKIGFQINELYDDPDSLREKIRHALEIKNATLKNLYNKPEITEQEVFDKLMLDATEGALYDFYRMYRKLRGKQDLPIHELIQKILQLSGYGNYAAALPAGERRAANLAMLVEKAVDYEKTSYRGLFHFLRYIDKLQKYEVDFGEADTTGENANVVRVMTIHKSKGLEFPVVFVSGLGRKMNQMDASDRLVVHPDLGLGICEISGQPRVKKNSVFRSEIADRIRRENLGEELRVLYVALTRVKEKLVLTGMIKDAPKTFSGYTGNVLPGKPVSYRQRGPGSQLPGLDSSGHAFLSAEIYARCGSTGKNCMGRGGTGGRQQGKL